MARDPPHEPRTEGSRNRAGQCPNNLVFFIFLVLAFLGSHGNPDPRLMLSWEKQNHFVSGCGWTMLYLVSEGDVCHSLEYTARAISLGLIRCSYSSAAVTHSGHPTLLHASRQRDRPETPGSLGPVDHQVRYRLPVSSSRELQTRGGSCSTRRIRI
jgi:hypothetical protein